MRNLKRVLSLALALVMVLGMMVITTSAAKFEDAEKITYTEAMDVAAGVGLFKGDENGNANPGQILSREDAATLMARIILGDKMAAGLAPTKQIFADVATDRWSAAAIEYCYNIGMIGGYTDANGDLVFNPKGELTGTAFAKLLLCALGYDAGAEGYAGAAWEQNINSDALTAGLMIDDVNISAPLTREAAAQMILQAMDGKMVDYTIAYDYATGAQIKVGPNVVTETVGFGFWAKEVPVLFVDTYFDGLTKTAAGNDKWGRPYDYQWTYGAKATVLYTAWEAPIAVYAEAVSDCDIAKAMGMKSDDNITAYINGEKDAEYFIDVSSQFKGNGDQGTLLEVYEDEIVVIDTYLAQVTKVTEEKTDKNGHVVVSAESDIYVWFDAEGTPDEIADETSYAEDSMILVNYNEEYDFYEIVGEAEYVVSYQSAFTTKASHILGDDEVEYPDAANFWLDEAVNSTEDHVWFFDQYGNLIGAVELPADPSTYGTISSIYWKDSFDGEDGYAVTKITYMDGTSETLKVTKIDRTALEGIEGNYADYEYGWVSSTLKYNKAEFTNKALYEVKTEKGETTLTTMAYLPGATTETGVPALTADVDAGNATMFLVWTGKAYETYTGIKKVPTYVSGDFWYVDEDGNDVVEYVFAIEPAGKAAGTSTLTYFWNGALTVKTYLKNSAQEYYVISGGYVDGVENTIKTKDAALKDQIVNELGCKLLVLTEKSGYVIAAETVTENAVKVDSLGAYVVYAGKSTVDKYHDVLVDENGNSYDIENVDKISCEHEGVKADYLYVVYKMGSKNTKIASLVYYTCTVGDEYEAPVVTPEVKGNLYSVKVLGVEIESEDGINYVAEVCDQALTTTGNRLEVVDNYAGAEMAIYFTNSNVAKFTGKGSVADNGTAVGDGSKWIVVSDGIEYTIEVVVKSHEAALTVKTGYETKVKIVDETIYVASTFANENSLTEAALTAALEVSEGAEFDYATKTVTAECGNEVEYAIAFVEAAAYPFV